MKFIAVILVASLAVAAATAVVQRSFQYKTLGNYDCKQQLIYELKPRFRKYPRQLEIYMGGWVMNDSLTITGFPSRDSETLTFSVNSGITTVSHAYIGEWYEPNTKIEFQPSEGAICYIRIIYKIR